MANEVPIQMQELWNGKLLSECATNIANIGTRMFTSCTAEPSPMDKREALYKMKDITWCLPVLLACVVVQQIVLMEANNSVALRKLVQLT